MYELRLAADPSDAARRDALTHARDVLLHGTGWQAPGPRLLPPSGVPVASTTLAPPVPPPPSFAAAPAPGYGPPASSTGFVYPPPSPPARRVSTGAIVGWSVGLIAFVTAGFLIVVLGIVFSPASATSWSDHAASASAASHSHVLDGVTVKYSGSGWTFILTSKQDCPAAKVVVGFGDTANGDSIDEFTDSVPLQAGVAYTYRIPDSTSRHPFAKVDEIVCHAM